VYGKKNQTLFFKFGFCILLYFLLPFFVYAKTRKQRFFLLTTKPEILGNLTLLLFSLKRVNPYTGKGLIFTTYKKKIKTRKSPNPLALNVISA